MGSWLDNTACICYDSLYKSGRTQQRRSESIDSASGQATSPSAFWSAGGFFYPWTESEEPVQIRVGCEFRYEAEWPTPAVLQVQPRLDGAHRVVRETWEITPDLAFMTIAISMTISAAG